MIGSSFGHLTRHSGGLLARGHSLKQSHLLTVLHRFSSDVVAKSTSNDVTAAAAAAADTSITSGNIMRHGKGDAVVVLNVGGKEFCTLRSTIAANAVLAEHVARAEANNEFTHGGNAIFIDRDPTYFPLILNHLRNKVAGLAYYTSNNKDAKEACSSVAKFHSRQKYHVQLPKDMESIRDIYVEASHYNEKDLIHAACEKSFIVSILGSFGSGSNPFDQASKTLSSLRQGLLAFGGLGALTAGSQQDLGKIMSSLFPVWFRKEEGTEVNQLAGS